MGDGGEPRRSVRAAQERAKTIGDFDWCDRRPSERADAARLDPCVDERRPLPAECLGEGRPRPGETIDGEGPGITAGGGDRRESDAGGNRRLASRAVVYAIVEQEMDEIARAEGADGREVAQLHQGGAVAVEDDDRAIDVAGDAETNGAGAAHRADLVEVLLAIREGEQLAAAPAGGRDDRRARRHVGEEPLEDGGAGRLLASLR